MSSTYFSDSSSAHQRAVSAAVIAAVALPVGDTLVKLMAVLVPILLIAWARSAVMTAVIGVMTVSQLGWQGLWPSEIRLQTLRSALALVAIITHYLAIKALPLAEVTAITFLSPPIAVAMSWFFLNEKPTRKGSMALFFGMLGVVLIARPHGGLFSLSVLLPIATAISLGAYLTVTRAVATRDHPMTTTFITSVVALILLSILLPYLPPYAASWQSVGTLVLIGALAAIGQLLTATAYRFGPTPLVAPIAYLGLVVAILSGWMVFDARPDAIAFVGMTLIVIGGLQTTKP